MSIALVFLMAATTVAAFLVTAARVVGMHRLLKYSTIVDVGFTILVGVLLAGTLTGILVAIVAGLMLALYLTVVKRAVKMYDHYTHKTDDEYTATGEWIYNQPPYMP